MRYGLTHVDIPFAGIGGFNLISRGFHTTTNAHTVQATETAVFAENKVNEVRFQFFRSSNQIRPNTIGPAIQVLGAFTVAPPRRDILSIHKTIMSFRIT